MARINKYTIKDLKTQFPNDDVALDFVFDTLHSRDCSCGGTYSRVKGRKQYQCSKCRFQIAPTAGTIFHKSETPLTDWFFALFIFSNAKSGISAKELERQLGCTYKTAWRMLWLIRQALKQDNDKLTGTVEMDTAYFGGRVSAGANNKNLSASMMAKTTVMGAVERGGKLRLKVVPNASAETISDFLENNVSKDAVLMTDNAKTYVNSAKPFNRSFVNHKISYVKGDIHINNIETLWGHIKRSIKGTQKVVSKQEFQSYLDGFAFHYNNRHSDTDRFAVLLGSALRGAR